MWRAPLPADRSSGGVTDEFDAAQLVVHFSGATQRVVTVDCHR